MIQPSDANQYAKVLSDNLREFTADLRTIDLSDLVAFLRFGCYATVEDLVLSSTELFFKSGTLNFAWTGEVDLPWDAQPSVTMGMEFRHRAVSVFFDLSLRAYDDTVKVCGILFEGDGDEADDKVARLSQAIAEARLPVRTALRSRI